MVLQQQTYVVVGASLAAAKAAQTLREEGFTGRLALIGDEAERPYERPPLSKGYLMGRDDKAKLYVHDEGWYQQNSVELQLGRRVTSLPSTATAWPTPQCRCETRWSATASGSQVNAADDAARAGDRTARRRWLFE